MNKRRNMALLFSLSVFVIILTSNLLAGVIGFIVFKPGTFINDGRPNPLYVILVISSISLLLGTILTAIGGKYILRPLRKLIAAIKDLSDGNFDVRIDLKTRYSPYEFQELTDCFNATAKELSSIELLRTDFVNNFSHEFKTPIVAMRGFAQLLKHGDVTEEEREEYLDVILKESERLASLSTNVLQLSKLENQTIITDCNTFNLTEQVRRTILLFDEKMTAKNLKLDAELEEVHFYGSQELLGQVWINIIDNAVKFSDRNGELWIRLADHGGTVTLEVGDTGCGIDEEARRHVFDKFYQGDHSHSTDGYGLGMSIVKNILDLCRGSIDYQSVEDEGTLVTVTLPKLAAEQP